ncbi:MAG: Lrp/AsnC family transcriptional regulator [Firmicutes bacterium]|nr:Lrp/AsnC family transcriptional regulator [Bacillota bacterium]
MDNIDIKILKILQKNARTTASEISSQINLSVPAVSDRLKKLETSGIIKQYTAIIDPVHLKRQLTAIMFISLERPKYTDLFAECIQQEDEILECHYIAGDFDYALKVITENTSTLEHLLNRMKSIRGVRKTKTVIVLSTFKNNYSITPHTE